MDDAINIATQFVTLGTVGYEGGRAKKGVTIQAIDEGVGELSGRNMQRKALMETKDEANRQKALLAQQAKDEQTLKERQDVQASQYAGAIRASAQAQQRNLLGTPNPARDFLGL
jgi:hypothetical protein